MAGEGLGWSTLNPSRQEVMHCVGQGRQWLIVGGDCGKKYFVKGFPELSSEEKDIVASVAEEFQQKDGKPSERNIQRHFKAHCIRNLVELEQGQKDYLLGFLKSVLLGFGALDALLEDPELEEIALIGIGREKPVFVFHRRHGWLPTNLFFESQQAVCDAVNRMSQKIGRRLTFQTPSINAVLPNGSRLHAAIGPVAFSGPCFTIRKFSKDFFTPLQLVESNTISAEAIAFIWMALESNCSMLVAGNTGSGKTTTLNALFSFVPRQERIIVVEETPEICLPQKHVVKMNVVEEQGIGMQRLIMDTLRMRPDRIVVGEVRSSNEMRAFIDTLLAGQGKGSYCTFHSQSSQEAVKRVIAMGISPMDLAAVDLVVVQRRWDRIEKSERREVRHVTEISELLLEGEKVAVNRLFEFDFGKGRLERRGESKKAVGQMEKCFGMQRKKLEMKMRDRERFLGAMIGKKVSLEEFFEKVNE